MIAHIVIAASFALSSPAAARSMPPRTDIIDGAELRIVDGDTVARDGIRLRIENIDAPETDPSRAACWYEQQLGQASSDILADFLIGQRIAIHYIGRIDPYDRPLVRLSNRAGDIGDQMIQAHAALPWAYGSKAKAWRKAQWCGR